MQEKEEGLCVCVYVCVGVCMCVCVCVWEIVTSADSVPLSRGH